jgi:hypothetical protein
LAGVAFFTAGFARVAGFAGVAGAAAGFATIFVAGFFAAGFLAAGFFAAGFAVINFFAGHSGSRGCDYCARYGSGFARIFLYRCASASSSI